MAEVLAEIVDHVRGVVERRRLDFPVQALRERPLFHAPVRDLASRLAGKGRRIIAEVKRASPSKGVIRADFDPAAIAAQYARHGASAISVLTEERFFQGSLASLEQVRRGVEVPVLRKDFIVDPYQLVEARSFGADAVLLIAAILEEGALRELREQARELALAALVEVHDERELESALKAGAELVGINNRDLRTFEVSLSTTERLAPLVPSGVTAVCESGIDSLEQIRRVEALGIRCFLVGESLMRASSPGEKLKELLS
ncbi:MAG TPA: indole-3-glycerol phosphate synthase TrpC [candidate division Zixibacteria bacterium]|nr:indole-3-glycerol phosphate synthase TrpC [candidate division Zixibacteria bacterium]